MSDDRHFAAIALCAFLLVLSSCSEDLKGNNPGGEPGDLAVVTSQGFPCSEREVAEQHYGFDFEADPTSQPALACSGSVSCMFCIPDTDTETTNVDLWVLEADDADETETCTYRLTKQLTNVPQEDAMREGSGLTDECFSP